MLMRIVAFSLFSNQPAYRTFNWVMDSLSEFALVAINKKIAPNG